MFQLSDIFSSSSYASGWGTQLPYQFLGLEKGKTCSAIVFAAPHLEPKKGQASARCTFQCSKDAGEFFSSLNSV